MTLGNGDPFGEERDREPEDAAQQRRVEVQEGGPERELDEEDRADDEPCGDERDVPEVRTPLVGDVVANEPGQRAREGERHRGVRADPEPRPRAPDLEPHRTLDAQEEEHREQDEPTGPGRRCEAHARRDRSGSQIRSGPGDRPSSGTVPHRVAADRDESDPIPVRVVAHLYFVRRRTAAMVAVDPKYCHQCGAHAESRDVHGRDRAVCPDCGFVMFRNAVPSAGVIVHDGDRLLLIRRAVPPDEGVWAFPGGHPEYDEAPVDAAARELEEEAGLRADPDDLSLVMVPHGSTRRGGDSEYHYYMITFAIDRSRTAGGIDLGPEAGDARFWPVEELLSDRDRTREIDRRRVRRFFRE